MSILDKSITYNDFNCDNYGLRFYLLDTTENKEVGGKLEYTNFKTNSDVRNYIQSVQYTDGFNYPIELLGENLLSDSVYREILNNLANQSDYCKLTFNNDLEYAGMYLNCYFTDVERFESGGKDGYGKYGLKANMICDSQFMWENEKTYTYTNFASNLVLKNISDVRDYTYPKVIITAGNSASTIQITNITDDNRVTSMSAVANEIITIDYNPITITSNLNNDKFTSFNKKCLRLVQGNNTLGVTGNISKLEIIYQNARMVI